VQEPILPLSRWSEQPKHTHDAEPLAEQHYLLAIRYYEQGWFEQTEVHCQKALKLNPHHRLAMQLLSDFRVLFPG